MPRPDAGAAVQRHWARAGGHSGGEAHLPAQSWNCVYPLTGAEQQRGSHPRGAPKIGTGIGTGTVVLYCPCECSVFTAVPEKLNRNNKEGDLRRQPVIT